MNLANIDVLKHEFSGTIISPEDSGYEQASTTYMFKGAPALVVQPTTAEDVVSAVQYALHNGLTLSIRSGGHSAPGFGTNNGGLVIDLSNLNQVELIDHNKHLVRIGAGTTWGKVAKTLQGHRLALSSGDTVSVGVGGLTLGGGIGWMVRKYGLAIDSLTAAQVVTSDGRILRASASENQDLFWALRGGGGNFGVVTYFEFEAHPIGKVYAGTIAYTLDNLSELLKGWRDYMRRAPEELSTSVTIMPSFGGNPPAAWVMCCYIGDDEAVLEPLKQLGTIMWQNVEQKEYVDVLEEAHPPEGIVAIVKNLLAPTFSDELIQATVASTGNPGGRVLQIRSLGGAMKRVAPDATAFAYRNSEIMMFSGTFVSPEASDAEIAEALKPWESLAAYGLGAYSNFLSTATDEDLRNIYPKTTYERLAKIKRIYDPQNLFNQNYNIKPG